MVTGMDDKATYTLTLKATGSGPPGVIRLRKALKVLLRGYGLRCTALSEVNPPADTPPPASTRVLESNPSKQEIQNEHRNFTTAPKST